MAGKVGRPRKNETKKTSEKKTETKEVTEETNEKKHKARYEIPDEDEILVEKTEEELDKEKKMSPSDYFDLIKGEITEETPENIKILYDVCMKKLKKYMVSGQVALSKALYARCIYLTKEIKAVNAGFNRYIERTTIDKYIDNVADDCVCVVNISNYEREIPDEIIDKVAKAKELFDNFFIIFTDYTGEKRKKVAKERRDKDPIMIANIYIDGRISPKMYIIGDWVDEYCDLTLDKMIDDFAKKGENDTIVYDVTNLETLEGIEKELENIKIGD